MITYRFQLECDKSESRDRVLLRNALNVEEHQLHCFFLNKKENQPIDWAKGEHSRDTCSGSPEHNHSTWRRVAGFLRELSQRSIFVSMRFCSSGCPCNRSRRKRIEGRRGGREVRGIWFEGRSRRGRIGGNLMRLENKDETPTAVAQQRKRKQIMKERRHARKIWTQSQTASESKRSLARSTSPWAFVNASIARLWSKPFSTNARKPSEKKEFSGSSWNK